MKARSDRFFPRDGEELMCEGVSLSSIARRFGTPTYVYSHGALEDACEEFRREFSSCSPQVFYAVKANTHRNVIRKVAHFGFGAEVVSGGEMTRALRAGVPANRVLFSGVGKTVEEIRRAISRKIFAMNCESVDEAAELAEALSRRKWGPGVLLRLNPNFSQDTHPFIETSRYQSKFGMTESEVFSCLALFKARSVRWLGLSVHLGSQIREPRSYQAILALLLRLSERARAMGLKPEYLDVGGGFACQYDDEPVPPLGEFSSMLQEGLRGTSVKLILEPGRRLVAEMGGLLTRVIRTKGNSEKNFVIVDAAMNDLIRPALYGAYHPVVRVRTGGEVKGVRGDIVGPICETSDVLALDREVGGIKKGDLLLIQMAGAYGASMASQYNSRPLPREVWVKGKTARAC